MDTTPITEVTTDKASEPVADDVENGDATIKSNGAEENNDEIDDEDEEDDIKAVEGEDEDTPMADETAGDMETENTEDASEGKEISVTDESSKEIKVHPYQHLIDNFEIPEQYLTKIKNVRTRPVNKVSCIFVSTRTMLSEIVERLALERDIGVVLKYNSLSYVQRLCLVLISTRRANYMIDSLKLQSSLHMLGDVFANPKVMKIMHGAARILKSLQLDYNLYFVNIFDTEAAMKKLKWRTLSLRAHIETFNVKLPQDMGLTKWHLRPLPEKYRMHALTHMHYLIPTYLSLRNKLIDAKMMVDFLKECNRRCGIIYKPTNSLENIFRDLAFLRPGQVYAIHELDEWRHRIARKKKKNVNMVLFRTNFQKLINKMPTKKAQVIDIAGSQFVANHADEVHKIFIDAKKVIGPINSRFAANVKLVNEQKKAITKTKKADKKSDAKDQTKDKKPTAAKGKPKGKGGIKPRAVLVKKGRVGGPPRKQNFKSNFMAREKPMGVRRGGVIKTTDRIDNGGFRFRRQALDRSRTGNGFPFVSTRDSGNGGGFNLRMPQSLMSSGRRDPFERIPDRPWQSRSPDRSRNFNSRPSIWEQPPQERDVWNAPSRDNFERWNNSPRNFDDLDIEKLLALRNRHNTGNSNMFKQNNFDDRNDFFNNQFSSNDRFGNVGNRGPSDTRFRRDEFSSINTSFRGFDNPSRNSDFVSYPKYNPSRYSNQGYF